MLAIIITMTMVTMIAIITMTMVATTMELRTNAKEIKNTCSI